MEDSQYRNCGTADGAFSWAGVVGTESRLECPPTAYNNASLCACRETPTAQSDSALKGKSPSGHYTRLHSAAPQLDGTSLATDSDTLECARWLREQPFMRSKHGLPSSIALGSFSFVLVYSD